MAILTCSTQGLRFQFNSPVRLLLQPPLSRQCRKRRPRNDAATRGFALLQLSRRSRRFRDLWAIQWLIAWRECMGPWVPYPTPRIYIVSFCQYYEYFIIANRDIKLSKHRSRYMVMIVIMSINNSIMILQKRVCTTNNCIMIANYSKFPGSSCRTYGS
jgi:hypothetical protein